jgi:hypothetical protein
VTGAKRDRPKGNDMLPAKRTTANRANISRQGKRVGGRVIANCRERDAPRTDSLSVRQGTPEIHNFRARDSDSASRERQLPV